MHVRARAPTITKQVVSRPHARRGQMQGLELGTAGATRSSSALSSTSSDRGGGPGGGKWWDDVFGEENGNGGGDTSSGPRNTSSRERVNTRRRSDSPSGNRRFFGDDFGGNDGETPANRPTRGGYGRNRRGGGGGGRGAAAGGGGQQTRQQRGRGYYDQQEQTRGYRNDYNDDDYDYDDRRGNRYGGRRNGNRRNTAYEERDDDFYNQRGGDDFYNGARRQDRWDSSPRYDDDGYDSYDNRRRRNNYGGGGRSRGGGRGGGRGGRGRGGGGYNNNRRQRYDDNNEVGSSYGNAPKMVDPQNAVWGTNPVLAALSSRRRDVHKLFVIDDEYHDISTNTARDIHRKARRRAVNMAEDLGIPVQRLAKHDLNLTIQQARRYASNRVGNALPRHQGLVLDAAELPLVNLGNRNNRLPEVPPRSACGMRTLWIALDSVQDPMNLGAVIRSAHFLGAAGVIVCTKNSARLNGTVSKASAGAMELTDVYETNRMDILLRNAVEDGYPVYAAEASDDSNSNDEDDEDDGVDYEDGEFDEDSSSSSSALDSIDMMEAQAAQVEMASSSDSDEEKSDASTSPLTLSDGSIPRIPEGGKAILVIGNEGDGLRYNIRVNCTELVSVPKSPACNPEVDSLNLSVATAILIQKLLNG